MAEFIQVQPSAFESNSLQKDIGFSVTHVETRWQIATSSTFDPADVTLDTWYSPTNLLELAITLDDGDWYFRCQFRDSYGVISEWSDPLLVVIEPPPTPAPDECSVITPALAGEFSIALLLTEEDHCPEQSATILTDEMSVTVPFSSCP